MLLLSQTQLLAVPLVEKLASHGLREVAQLLAHAATPDGRMGLVRFLGLSPAKLDTLLDQLRAAYPAEDRAVRSLGPTLRPSYGLLLDE